MRLRYSLSAIIIYFTGLGLNFSPANGLMLGGTNYEVAQANYTNTVSQSTLQFGSRGEDVETLQIQLKELGYYQDAIDSQYGAGTRSAVSQFQEDKGLPDSGIADVATRKLIQAEITQKRNFITPTTSQPTTPPQKDESLWNGFSWWVLIAIALVGTLGAILYLIKRFRGEKNFALDSTSELPSTVSSKSKLLMGEVNEDIHSQSDSSQVHQTQNLVDPAPLTQSPHSLTPTQTSKLAEINVIDPMLADLSSSDPKIRRKAIWNLSQQGDSRAIPPLMELMVDADSQQRSLILGALSEITSRTLKPMNRALAISLQDESPQVRQNAIRDLTRIYDTMAQISQMLAHALDDSDPEVQETAKYALSKMNSIRYLPTQDIESQTAQLEEYDD